jgi:hypothetical protein
MIVRLNKVEFYNAAHIGLIRQLQNINKGRKDSYGAETMDGWGIHIEGACGELVVAKVLNIFYNGNIGDLSACDVNNEERNIEVRTRSNHRYDLILHPKDKDENVFILVTGKAPLYKIRGWILAKEGKKKKYWSDPSGKNRPAFFIPQKDLKPIKELSAFLLKASKIKAH